MLSINRHEGIFIIFLALIGATPPLATDMYLAAIPLIAGEWNVGEHLVNLSLVLWFASFSVMLLICGPLSDKFGRKVILLSGLILFVISSYLCMISTSVWQLIIFRIIQGAGASAPSAMVMAICRDKYDGEMRRKALAYIGIVLAVAPMVAPMIGAFLLEFGSWRYIFAVQGTMVFITLLISLGFSETNTSLFQGSWHSVFLRYSSLFRNRNYMKTNSSMGIITGPFFGFLAFSPIYYIGLHGFSEKQFSVFFGLNALGSMIGSFVCTRLLKVMKPEKLMTLSLGGCVAGGAGVFFLGWLGYMYFFVFMFIFTFASSMTRPLSGNLILEQVETDIGAASSFMVFYQFIFGSLCMFLVSGQWSRPLLVFASTVFFISLFVFITWQALKKTLKNM
jgi:DHA1 family bicyclomycin/chloramphenicol resistance-like MFS transporter